MQKPVSGKGRTTGPAAPAEEAPPGAASFSRATGRAGYRVGIILLGGAGAGIGLLLKLLPGQPRLPQQEPLPAPSSQTP